MIENVILFVLVCSVVGAVNLIVSEPLERPAWREFLSFFVVVVGGITAFTAIIMTLSIFLQ